MKIKMKIKKIVLLIALFVSSLSFAQGTKISAPSTTEADSLLVLDGNRINHIPYTQLKTKILQNVPIKVDTTKEYQVAVWKGDGIIEGTDNFKFYSQTGVLDVGQNDTQRGVLNLYGGESTYDDGLIRLWNNALGDNTEEGWSIGASGKDFYISGMTSGALIEYDQTFDLINIPRSRIRLGILNDTYGNLELTGSQTQGGTLTIFNAQNTNSNNFAYYINTNASGDFAINRNNGITAFLTHKESNQQMQFNDYGSGAFLGTAAYSLQVDSEGNLLEGDLLPTTTSELVNDGADGINPFITALDITSIGLQEVTDIGNTTTNNIYANSFNDLELFAQVGVDVDNIGIGINALEFNAASSSIGVGTNSLQNNTGTNSNGFGGYSLQDNTGTNSNGFGYYSLRYNIGNQVHGFGNYSLENNTGNSSNGFGLSALRNNTGTNSNGFGNYSLENNTGIYSNGFGLNSLSNNTGISANGFGNFSLQSNTGGNSNGFGYTSLQNNTSSNSNGFGNYSLQNNTGSNSNGFGYYSLRYNTGINSNGFGNYSLQNNIGNSSNGFGTNSLLNNTSNNSNGFGNSSLRYNAGTNSNGFGGNSSTYNEGDNNTAIGHNSNSTFKDDTGGAKNVADASTDVDTALNRITITSHGFGSNGSYVNLRYTTTGTVIGGLFDNNIYQFQIIDANTIEYIGNISSVGTDTHTFTPQFVYNNITVLGAYAEPTKSNQVTLGDTNVTEVYTDGHIKTHKEVKNDTTTAYELVLTDRNSVVTMNNAGANTLTIPANSSVAFPIGTEIVLINKGAGTTTVAITTDTLNQNVGGLTLAQYDKRTLVKIAATEWVMGY